MLVEIVIEDVVEFLYLSVRCIVSFLLSVRWNIELSVFFDNDGRDRGFVFRPCMTSLPDRGRKIAAIVFRENRNKK